MSRSKYKIIYSAYDEDGFVHYVFADSLEHARFVFFANVYFPLDANVFIHDIVLVDSSDI